MPATIKATNYYLPEKILSNENILETHPDWPIEKISRKTGIYSRRIAGEDQYSLEMGICAAKSLLSKNNISKEEIDFIIFCTQTPKFLLPSSACLIQEALNLKQEVGALDVNQGCSGYVYSLMLAEGIIVSKRAKNILLITSDSYSKLIDGNDRCLVPVFGDAASASLISYVEEGGIEFFEYGTNGAGAEKLIAPFSGVKGLTSAVVYKPDLYMNGSAIFNFTLLTIPRIIDKLLEKAGLHKEAIDLFIFHQANAYMLEHLREKINIKPEKFFIHMQDIGNTVSSSIPIAINEAILRGKIKSGHKIMLVGFGVGLSWSACLINW